jgi:hypothetical protein
MKNLIFSGFSNVKKIVENVEWMHMSLNWAKELLFDN